MSQAIASQRPPSARAAVSSIGSRRLPHTTTCAPSAANSSALARPSPDPPPLTIATCPSSRPDWNSREGIARGAYPRAASAHVLPVEAERDVVRGLRPRELLEAARVEDDQ